MKKYVNQTFYRKHLSQRSAIYKHYMQNWLKIMTLLFLFIYRAGLAGQTRRRQARGRWFAESMCIRTIQKCVGLLKVLIAAKLRDEQTQAKRRRPLSSILVQ